MRRAALLVLALAGCRAQAAPAKPATSPSVKAPSARVVHIEAKRFAFNPSRIELKRGEPVVLELVSLDREHGFDLPAFGLNATIEPEKPTRVSFTPDRAGTFLFHCDVFCGSGHEQMEGELVVSD